MMRNSSKMAVVLACVAWAAALPAGAQALGVDGYHSTDPEGPAVWIVNDHGLPLRVYVVTKDGRAHWLRNVDTGVESLLALPSGLIGDGPVQIRVEPIRPQPGLGVSVERGVAIRTRDLTLCCNDEIFFYVEPDLFRSSVYGAAG